MPLNDLRRHAFPSQQGMARAVPPGAGLIAPDLVRRSGPQATPSFFCRLVEEVVYWKVRRLSGYT